MRNTGEKGEREEREEESEREDRGARHAGGGASTRDREGEVRGQEQGTDEEDKETPRLRETATGEHHGEEEERIGHGCDGQEAKTEDNGTRTNAGTRERQEEHGRQDGCPR